MGLSRIQTRSALPPKLIPFCVTRFALQLLTPASILSKLQGRTSITLEDVRETDSLFLDARASARNLSGGSNGSSTGGGDDGRAEYLR